MHVRAYTVYFAQARLMVLNVGGSSEKPGYLLVPVRVGQISASSKPG